MPRLLAESALIMLLSALALWGAFTLWVLHGDNYRHVFAEVTVKPNVLDWQMLGGQGVAAEDEFLVVRPGFRALSRVGIHLPQTLQTGHFDSIELVADRNHGLRSRLYWSETRTFDDFRSAALHFDDAGRAESDLRGSPGWRGEINHLAVEFFGHIDDPIRLQAIRIHPAAPDFGVLQGHLWGAWSQYQPWTQRNMNNLPAPQSGMSFSPLVAVAAWVVLSTLILSLCFRRRPAARFALLLPLLMGWLVLDARWQADLLYKAQATWRTFAGLEWHERRAADIDGELFEWVEALKQQLGTGQRRVFALDYADFGPTRARYHGLPWSVRAAEDELDRRLVASLQAGDLVLLLGAPRVARETITMDRGSDVEPVLSLVSAGAPRRHDWAVHHRQPGWQIANREFLTPGFYRFAFEGARESDQDIELQILLRERQSRDILGERRFWFAATQSMRGSLAFAVPAITGVEIDIVVSDGGDFELREAELERLSEPELLYLHGESGGPYVAGRVISRQGDWLALWVL